MNPPDQLIDDLRLLEPPEPFRLNPWMVVAVVVLAVAAWWFIRRRRATRGARLQAQAIHQAHDDALAELERLFTLIEREESRHYAQESSTIIRRYIETRLRPQSWNMGLLSSDARTGIHNYLHMRWSNSASTIDASGPSTCGACQYPGLDCTMLSVSSSTGPCEGV